MFENKNVLRERALARLLPHVFRIKFYFRFDAAVLNVGLAWPLKNDGY